jgi:patatin-like phospholipase/acyl hydrolase
MIVISHSGAGTEAASRDHTDMATPAMVDSKAGASEGVAGPCRVLSLDGGGAKGFYTLGALKEIEALVGQPLAERFDLIFGTSTGAIIAALLGLGRSVDEIHTLYRKHVVSVMAKKGDEAKSAALRLLAEQVFADARFDQMKTGVGLVCTNWLLQRPMIFKSATRQAHGMKGTFKPGFGCTISDAVQASCSAFPFFKLKTVTTEQGDKVVLADGGYCANNPTLYAIADATEALQHARVDVRVVSIGVGVYPKPPTALLSKGWWGKRLIGADLLDKTFEINTQSMEQLRAVLFHDVETVRVNDTFSEPEMATDLFEHNLDKLNVLRQRGRASFAKHEAQIRRLML